MYKWFYVDFGWMILRFVDWMNEEKADHPISDTMAAEVLMDYYEIPEKRPTFREHRERKTSYSKFNLDGK